jgi:multidrug efflux system outer membrane protein
MKKLLLYIFLLAGMWGCMLGPNFQKSSYEGPEQFRFDSTGERESINLRWWEIFEDEVLDTLIFVALENNKDVQIAASRIEAARANIGYTKADQWPAFRYGAGASVSGASGNVSSGLNVYPELSWEIGFWGKYRRMNEAAQANLLANQYARETIRLGLVSAVVSTYYSILAGYDQLALATNTLASRDSGLVIMQDKYEGGLISQMDLNQASIQRDVAATVVPVYKRIIALNENALSLLLGREPFSIPVSSPFYQHEYILDIPAGIPSEMLMRRPDIQQSEYTYMAKNAQIGVAEAMRWPSFSLTGFMGAASSDLTNLSTTGLAWSAGASIFGPIFQFGKNRDRVVIATQEAQAALLQYEQTTLNAFKEVEDALVQISTYREEMVAQESRTYTAIETEELAYVRYEEGTTTYLEVLEQQRQSFSAQLDLLANRLNIVNSYILLYKALGGGWLTPEEEQEFLEQQELEQQELEQELEQQ